MRLSVLLIALSAICAAARADVVLAPLFSDHAVLQHGKPVPVWGRADPGEHVTVGFGGQSIGSVADDNGRWIVYLEALQPSAVPAQLVVTGKNTVWVNDVVVGEVWLCSGQSNMEWPLIRAANGEEEAARANNPLLRHVAVRRNVAGQPSDLVSTSGWQLTTPQTAGGFTAVGYFFAKDIQPRIGIPVGIIHSSWGGTPIEAWLSPSALGSNPSFSVVGQRWKQILAEYPQKKTEYDKVVAERTAADAAAKAKGEKINWPYLRRPPGPGTEDTPTGLFNGMINPLVPYALRGVLWYQGETNTSHPHEYKGLFRAMITYWRTHFGQGDFPFYWVQLPNYKGSGVAGTEWAILRESQNAALTLPGTGQAITIDIGNVEDIHPTGKQEVGRRLALIARANVYGSTVDYTGPIFDKAEREGAAMRVRFALGADGLTAHEKPLQAFEIAGADKKFYPATAVIQGNTLLVSSPSVKEPMAVRYAWANAPVANLYNSAGLPAAPFRSDSW